MTCNLRGLPVSVTGVLGLKVCATFLGLSLSNFLLRPQRQLCLSAVLWVPLKNQDAVMPAEHFRLFDFPVSSAEMVKRRHFQLSRSPPTQKEKKKQQTGLCCASATACSILITFVRLSMKQLTTHTDTHTWLMNQIANIIFNVTGSS